MKLIKKLYSKMIQLKEMITDQKGYRYNKALYEITNGIALAERIGDEGLRIKYANEFLILKKYGHKAWKSYKELNKQ